MGDSIKFVMWGYGIRGKRVYCRTGKQYINAIIDNDESKQGVTDDRIPIISFEQYLKHYTQNIIIITMVQYEPVVDLLEKMGIYQYLLLDECPYELYSDMKENIIDYLLDDINKEDAIYGLSLYSILLQERIQKERKITIPILPWNISCVKRLQILMAILNNVKCESDIEKYINNGKRIFVTTDIDYDNLCGKYEGQKELFVNAYDFSYKIPYYYNFRIERFRNTHRNQRIFIVCTGPSLKTEDLEKLANEHEISMSMNNVFRVFEQVKWRPDYYVAMDVTCLKFMKSEIISMDVDNKFIGDLDMSFYDQCIPDNLYKFHCRYEDRKKIRRTFSEDISNWVSTSFDSVTYVCIQFAVYMGAKEIILLGCDNSFNAGNLKKKESHFIDNYYKGFPQKVNCYVNKECILNAYRCAKEYADSHGIKIYNATRGGELEVFERVNFDSLF